MDSLPRIRQTIFIVDKNRNYKFDVNQTITIRNLKKMIIAAANLGKVGLRIFHKDVEFTDMEDSSLADLFPSLQIVEFQLQISRLSEAESKIKLKLGPHCKYHSVKYPYFYCYDCKESICSLCVQNSSHKGHNIMEKNDYLQSSSNIVNNLFQDLTQNFSIISERSDEINKMKNSIELDYFPSLMDLLRKIEVKLMDLVDFYNSSNDVSFTNLKTNANLLKSHCAEGLDELKNKIEIEDMMVNEDIFLTFDRKVKEISLERNRIDKDVNKLQDLGNVIQDIRTAIESIYLELKKFLEGYLNSDFYDKIKENIDKNAITLISKEEIFKKLLSNLDRKDGKITPSFSRMETPRTNLANLLSYGKKDEDLGATVYSEAKSHRATVGPFNFPAFSAKKPEYIELSSHVPEISTEQRRQTETVSKAIMPIEGNYVVRPIFNTNNYEIFEDKTSQIRTVSVEFPSLFGVNKFLNHCAYCNHDGRLYVSGGEESLGQGSSLFFYINVHNNSAIRLPDPGVQKHAHSMIAHKDIIYLVGGYNSNSVLQFDIKTQQWTKRSPMHQKRERPILHFYKNFLYVFFGYFQGAYLDSIERFSLKGTKNKWEVVGYLNEGKLDLKMIGCGVLEESDAAIYLLGGKNALGINSSVVSFDFQNFTFQATEITLDHSFYTMESQMQYLSNNTFGQFNFGEGETFLKISLD